jgi:hypothetical protein
MNRVAGHRRFRAAAVVGLATAALTCLVSTLVALWRAEQQSDVRNGLYPGGLFVVIDASGDPDLLPPASAPAASVPTLTFRPVSFLIVLHRYGTESVIYYDRLSVGTANAKPALPTPPSGWGAAVQANKAKLKNRPEFVAFGLDKTEVDWLAVGRGETWSHVDVHWDAVRRLAGRNSVIGALVGIGAAVLYPPMGAAFAVWRRRRSAGRCARCGYNMAGLAPNTGCPECGSPPTL